MARPKLLWRQGLVSGMDQATNPNLVRDNEAQLLKNVSLDQPGSWSSRRGETRVGDLIASTDAPWGLFAYSKFDGTFKLGTVTGRDLYFLNEGTGEWGAAVDTDEWPATTRVDAVNFLNRLYLGSEDGATPLAYTTGSTVTDVTPLIGGSQLAVNKNQLAVAGNSLLPNVIFYSKPFTDTFHHATGTCGANADTAGTGTVTATTDIFEPGYIGSILYNTTDSQMVLITGWRSGTVVETNGDTSGWDNDTVYVLKNNFKCDGKVKGLVGYGEYFIAWDEHKMYCWDPTQQPNGWSIEYKAGCSDYRTVGVIDDIVIFANRNALMLYAGQGKPIDITSKIRNKITDDGIYDLLNRANFGTLAAGVKPGEGIYKLSMGTLATKTGALASALANVELIFDVKKNAGYIATRNQKPVVYTNFINSSGELDLLYGASNDAAVYKTDTGVVDSDKSGNPVRIQMDIVTQDYRLSDPRVQTRGSEFPIQYISKCPIDVELSVNRGEFVELGTLPISETVKVLTILPPSNTTSGNIDGFSYRLRFKSRNVGPLDITDETGVTTVTGLDDLALGTNYTDVDSRQYRVEIDGEGTPDTFKWSNDGGETWEATGVSITGSAQTLEDGVQITFGATTGHTEGDYWDFEVGPTDVVIEGYGIVHSDLGTLTLPSR